MLTWTNRDSSASVLRRSYIDRILVRRVDLGVLTLHVSIPYSNHRFLQVCLDLEKPRFSMAGYWKFNTLLFDEKDIQDQILIILMRELIGTVVGRLLLIMVSSSTTIDKQRKQHKDLE